MNRLSKKFLSLGLAAFTALGCVVTSSASSVTYGDINNDSVINSADALDALRHGVGLIELTEDALIAADVNADGNINASDALEILRYAVKAIDRFPAEDKADDGGEDEVQVPATKQDILALYSQTVSHAREEIPAYKIRVNSKTVDAKMSGSMLAMIPADELKKQEESLYKEEVRTNLLRADSATALSYLPAECTVTDPSLFKDITCVALEDGNLQIDISFKDDNNPTANSIVVKMLDLLDKKSFEELMEEQMKSVTEGEGLEVSMTVEVPEYAYKNCTITCVVNPETGELVSFKTAYDIVSAVDLIVPMGPLKLNTRTDTTARNILEYSNFIY